MGIYLVCDRCPLAISPKELRPFDSVQFNYRPKFFSDREEYYMAMVSKVGRFSFTAFVSYVCDLKAGGKSVEPAQERRFWFSRVDLSSLASPSHTKDPFIFSMP